MSLQQRCAAASLADIREELEDLQQLVLLQHLDNAAHHSAQTSHIDCERTQEETLFKTIYRSVRLDSVKCTEMDLDIFQVGVIRFLEFIPFSVDEYIKFRISKLINDFLH